MKRSIISVVGALGALVSFLILFGERHCDAGVINDTKGKPQKEDRQIGFPFAFPKFKGGIRRFPRPWLSPEKAVDLYVEFQEKGSGIWDKGYGFGNAMFLDLDFDGVLELVYTTEEGSACCLYTSIYTIDKGSGKVREVENDASASQDDWCGMNWNPSNAWLVADRKTAIKSFILTGSVRTDSRCHGFFQQAKRFELKGCGFKGMTVATIDAERPESSQMEDPYCWQFALNNRKFGRDEFLAELKRYSEGFYDLGLKFEAVEGVNRMRGEELKKALLKSYRAFSYGRPEAEK